MNTLVFFYNVVDRLVVRGGDYIPRYVGCVTQMLPRSAPTFTTGQMEDKYTNLILLVGRKAGNQGTISHDTKAL